MNSLTAQIVSVNSLTTKSLHTTSQLEATFFCTKMFREEEEKGEGKRGTDM